MSAMPVRTFVHRVVIALLLTAAAAAVAVLLARFPQVPLMVFGGVLGAVFLDGLAGPLRRRLKAPRGLAVCVVVLLLVGLLAGVGWFSGPRIAQEASMLSDRLPDMLATVDHLVFDNGWIQRLWPPSSQGEGRKMLADAMSGVAHSLGSMVSLVSIALTGLLAVVVLSIFLAIQPELYVGSLLRLVPPRRRDRIREVLDAVAHALRWWLVGRFTAMTAVGLLTLVGLLGLGIPMALVLALMAGLLSFIPYLGPVLSAAPAILVAMAESPSMGLWIIALYTGVQLVENNLLTPLVQQRAVSLPPAVLIVAQLLMGVLFGLLGVLLATPITVAAIVMGQAFYVQDVLGDDVRLLGQNHARRSEAGGDADREREAAPQRSR